MKLYYSISLFVIVNIIIFGQIIPFMISYDNDMVVGIAVLFVIVYIPIVYKWVKLNINMIDEKVKNGEKEDA